MLYPSLLLNGLFMITLKTVEKPQGVFCVFYIFTFMASFVILTSECTKISESIILLLEKGYKEISLATIDYISLLPIIAQQCASEQ